MQSIGVITVINVCMGQSRRLLLFRHPGRVEGALMGAVVAATADVVADVMAGIFFSHFLKIFTISEGRKMLKHAFSPIESLIRVTTLLIAVTKMSINTFF